MASDLSEKMTMSLDDIIMSEQKKKNFIRIQSSDDEGDFRSGRSTPIDIEGQPEIRMVLPDFSPDPIFFKNSFQSKQSANNMNNMNNMFQPMRTQRAPKIRKHYNGIPLIKFKRRPYEDRGNEGRPNSYSMWRQRSFGRNFQQRYFFPNQRSQLSFRNLNRFNQEYPPTFTKRGPGSVGSRGSVAESMCSNYSQRSFRSNTSFRSNRSFGSFPSSNNRSSFGSKKNRPYRFYCRLNVNIQREVRNLQENKDLRIKDTVRESLIDEPTQCTPNPDTTGISFNHRFKKFIVNIDDL